MFFAFNLLASAFQRSGEILIRFFYPDYVQVAYFGLAYNVFHHDFTIHSTLNFGLRPIVDHSARPGRIENPKAMVRAPDQMAECGRGVCGV